YTLARLLEDYANELERLGRSSHRDVRSIFRLHVLERWPDKANQSATEITADEITDMQRAVINLGKGRTANKLRSYLRAAYQTAKKARTKASIPEHFKAYGVRDNPVEDTEPDESANKPDKNPLAIEELCSYWQMIESLNDFRGALLRLHLLTGGQRIEQLVKLKTHDIARDFSSFTLVDSKGRPGKKPRDHVVPLTAAAQAALRACKPTGEYALSTNGGTTHVTATTLSKWAVGVVEAAEADTGSGATAAAVEAIPDFQAKRIRSGVETLLSTAGASLEIRGHLQSHGISGIQKRHYDANDFLPAKLAALETLYRTLKSGELKKYKLN
ncbi:MAG: integrase, partial [Burkholderiales bacterium]